MILASYAVQGSVHAGLSFLASIIGGFLKLDRLEDDAQKAARPAIHSKTQSKLSAAIFADKFSLREDVTFHGAFDVGLGGPCFQIQLPIQRVEFEKITVRIARRRA